MAITKAAGRGHALEFFGYADQNKKRYIGPHLLLAQRHDAPRSFPRLGLGSAGGCERPGKGGRSGLGTLAYERRSQVTQNSSSCSHDWPRFRACSFCCEGAL